MAKRATYKTLKNLFIPHRVVVIELNNGVCGFMNVDDAYAIIRKDNGWCADVDTVFDRYVKAEYKLNSNQLIENQKYNYNKVVFFKKPTKFGMNYIVEDVLKALKDMNNE